MPVTATDVISADEVNAVLEERTQSMYQFRRAFREDDATDINSSTKTFPRAATSLESDMTQVDEEENYPRSALEHEGVNANYTKDGFEVAVGDEAADDSVVDIILDVVEEMGVAAESHLDAQAYTVLDGNNNATSIGTNGTALNFPAVVDTYTALVDDQFNPQGFETYLSPSAWGDLAKDDNFNRATDEGDNLARNGMLQEGFGVGFALSNTGDLGATEGLMVDTGFYGYESTRWPRETTSYREEKQDRDVFKVRVRNDFVATNPDAAVVMNGGV